MISLRFSTDSWEVLCLSEVPWLWVVCSCWKPHQWRLTWFPVVANCRIVPRPKSPWLPFWSLFCLAAVALFLSSSVLQTEKITYEWLGSCFKLILFFKKLKKMSLILFSAPSVLIWLKKPTWRNVDTASGKIFVSRGAGDLTSLWNPFLEFSATSVFCPCAEEIKIKI